MRRAAMRVIGPGEAWQAGASGGSILAKMMVRAQEIDRQGRLQ